MRSRLVHGTAAVVGALFLAGCGAALTGVVGGALFATKSGGSGGGGGAPNSASTIPTAVVSSNSGAGTVVLSLALTDAESDGVEVQVRYSTDPNDPATAEFPNVATGTIADALGAVIAATQVPTSASGINYAFAWNTAQDLGTVKVDNVRLQVLLRMAGSSTAFAVGNTTSTFVIDNTQAPVIASATLAALPAGASIYADDQAGRGFIPVTVVVADAESTPVSLRAFFSLDGGVSFPSQNQAAGFFVDGTGTVRAPDALPTSPSGTAYTFRFNSTASGVATGGQAAVVLQFQAADSKASAPRNATTPQGATVFGVNNASFTAIVNTPSGSQVTDKVLLAYRLIDAASQPLDVEVLVTIPGLATARATPVPQPPHTGATNLPSSPSGTSQFFVWNAFYDMVVQNDVPTSAGIAAQLFLTRPTTQVRRGPFPTSTFSVDHRLIQTIFNESAGVVDDVPGNSQPLGSPGAMARFNTVLYFCDEKTNRVRGIDLVTRKIATVVGGGASRQDGTLGTDYGLGRPVGIAASPAQGGTLFITEQFTDPSGSGQLSRSIRVDGSTPVVTSFPSPNGGSDRILALDGATDLLFFEVNGGSKRIIAVEATGTQPSQQIAGVFTGSGTSPPDDGTPVAAGNAWIGDGDSIGGAVDTTRYGKLLFISEDDNGRILGINYNSLGGATVSAFGRTIPPQSVVALVTGLVRPKGVAIVERTVPGVVDRDDLVVVEEQGQRVSRIAKNTGVVTTLVGSATGVFGFAGEGKDPLEALMVFPRWIASLGAAASDILAVADQNNGRIRSLLSPSPGLPNGSFVTIGGSAFVVGDGGLAATAQFRVPSSVAAIGSDILVADPILSRIRRVNTTSWRIDTVAGTGGPGLNGDGGQALAAEMGLVNCVAADPSGAYYFSQLQSHVVRRVDTSGVVTRIAGTGAAGAPPLADGTEPATTVPINSPSVMASQGDTLAIATLVSAVYVVNLGAVPLTYGPISIQPGAIARVAGGSAVVSPPADDTLATSACLITVEGLSIAPNGDLFISDSAWSAVYRVRKSDGKIFREVGVAGTDGFNGDGQDPLLTELSDPSGIHYDAARDLLYVADSRNGRIRCVNRSSSNVTAHGVAIAAKTVGTVAGGGMPQVEDNGPAIQSQVNVIQGVGTTLFLTSTGDLVFADGDSGRVRRVAPDGTIYTVAGLDLVDDAEIGDANGRPAENATLLRPTAILTLSGGAYLVVDSGRIRRVDPDTTRVTRIGGVGQQQAFGDGGALRDASFENSRTTNPFQDATTDTLGPRAIAVSGTAFVTSLLAVADTANHTVRIANIGTVTFASGPPLNLTIPPGEIRRLCGTGTAGGLAGDGNVVDSSTTLSAPQGLAFTSNGLLLVADTDNDAVRAINLSAGAVQITGKTLVPGEIDSISVITTGGAGVLLTKPRAIALNEPDNLLIVQNGDGAGPNPPAILAIYLVSSPTASRTVHGRSFTQPGQSERIDFGQGSLFSSGGQFDVPRGVALDPVTRDVYYAVRESVSSGPMGVPGQTGHTLNRIPFFVSPFSSSSVQRVAGIANSPGIAGDGGLGVQAQLNSPCAVSIDEQGDVYVLDGRNFRVRRLRKFP